MNDPGQALLQVASEQGFLGQRDEENIRKGKLREPFWRMWLNSQPAQRHSQKSQRGYRKHQYYPAELANFIEGFCYE